MGLQFSLLMRLLIGSGFVAGGPAVTSITSATQTEGTSLVHMVTLAEAVSVVPAAYTFSISSVTASTPSDYTATPTFSSGITLLGGTISVPVGVSSFTVTVPTTQDTIFEGSETYSITVGAMTSTGTLTDDESAPTIASVSSASATEGGSIVHTVVITGTAEAARTFAISLSGGTATGGTDYTNSITNAMFSASITYSGGFITVQPGTPSFTVTIPTSVDALVEGNETYTLSIGGASGTGTIVDANQADFFLNLSAATNATISDAQATGTITTVPSDFYLNLSSAVNATISDSQAAGTITGSGGSLTVRVTESALSGVAPFAVFFDASATTSTQTTRPMHDVAYWSDFGDTGAGNWAYGAGVNSSRNAAIGFVSAHVYETPGTYTFTQYASDGNSTSFVTKTITVADPDVEFAGNKTVCYSEGGDFTGAPVGCIEVTVAGTTNDAVTKLAANIGAGNKRHLWRAGQTFTLAGSLAINVGGGANHFGKFGSGAKPLFVATTTAPMVALSSTGTPNGVTNWRFQDIALDCASLDTVGFNGSGHASDVLIHRVDISNTIGSLSLSGSQLDAYNSTTNFLHAMWDRFAFIDSTVNGLRAGDGANGLFVNCNRFALMGSSINTNGLGEHGVRTQLLNRAVISNNNFTGIVAGKHHLTIRGTNFAGTNSVVAGTYTEKVVVCDNKFTGGVNQEIMTMAPQFATSNERGRNLIVERNWFEGTTDSRYFIKSAQTDVTVRNNVAYVPNNEGGNFVNAKDEDVDGRFYPDRVHVYNNTVYHASNSANAFSLFEAIGNSVNLSGCVFDVRNNVLCAPNGASNMRISSNGGWPIVSVATINASNNTGNSGAIATNPGFATTPPTALAHFTLSGGSYANGTGTSVKNWRDMYGTTTDATPDMGAVRIA